jgi:thiamine pyrophosphate-dependent acetolactate synthase large subunit-like protein
MVGQTLAECGVRAAFGLTGSGNLVAMNALVERGASFYSANHEAGATAMADGYARVTGELGVVSVHQGPGLTNTVTALVEATKSRTPLLVVAGDTDTRLTGGNLDIDQDALARMCGAGAERIRSRETARRDVLRAVRRSMFERRPVVLSMPIDLQARPAPPSRAGALGLPIPAEASGEAIEEVATLIASASRPVVLAGRGAIIADASAALEALADRAGALLATTAVAKDMFRGHPYSIGFAGGFALDLARQLLPQADLVLAFGASLNKWTLASGRMLDASAVVVQCDVDPAAFGEHRTVDCCLLGDARLTADALVRELDRRDIKPAGFRTRDVARQIAANDPAAGFYDASTASRLDPRTLMVELDRRLPHPRALVTDAGHHQGFPARYINVDRDRGFVMPVAFQSVGLGLAEAIGAAVGRRERLTVAVVGDGGLMMSLPEIDSAVRHEVPVLVVVANDAAYGAETHHFEPLGIDASLARFPDRDLAGIARSMGAAGGSVRSIDDLVQLTDWLNDPTGPLVLDCKINETVRADYIAEAAAQEELDDA